MRLCYVADARSPIARNWIGHFATSGHEVHVISSHPGASPIEGAASSRAVPLGFSDLVAPRSGRTSTRGSGIAGTFGATVTGYLAGFRYSLGAFDVYRHTAELRRAIAEIEPDVVHAMRIPFEGIATAEALRHVRVPLVVSVWGNDFTLHARRNVVMGALTRRAIARADALHPDAARDLRLAREWGFAADKTAVVLPSGGGIRRSVFHAGPATRAWRRELEIPPDAVVVVNSRGFRQYVRNDTFFRAIPLVREQCPKVVFVCPGMEGSRVARQWIERLDLASAVRLLPLLPPEELADLFRLSAVTVSITEHDGTPNTLLEAMTCGAFPVAGDLESIREWIDDARNGFLCDPADAMDVARSIGRAIEDETLRRDAAVVNEALVRARADHEDVMAVAAALYERVTEVRHAA